MKTFDVGALLIAVLLPATLPAASTSLLWFPNAGGRAAGTGQFPAGDEIHVVSRLPEGCIIEIPDSLQPGVHSALPHIHLASDPWFHPCFLVFLSPRSRQWRDLPSLGDLIPLTSDLAFLRLSSGTAEQLLATGAEAIRLGPHSLNLQSPHRTPLPNPLPDSLISQILAHVSQDSITSYIQRLQDFRTRQAYTESCQAAAMYLLGRFASWGISASIDFIPYGTGTGMSIIATIPGKLYPDRLNIICGHYDSTSDSASTNAPGADDDASGTAVVLEAARVMNRFEWESTIQFIAFWGEEIGLVGSKHYADSAYARGIDIRGVIDFDMAAYHPDSSFDFYVFPLNSDTGGIADLWVDACTTYTTLNPIRTYTGYGSSDFYWFMQYGYPTSRCRDNHYAADNPNYHHTTDRIETLNLPYATEVVKSGIATLAALAGPYITGIETEGETPPLPVKDTWSIGAVPNPFSSSTRIRLCWSPNGSSPSGAGAHNPLAWSLGIYDLTGRRLRTLRPLPAPNSPRSVSFDWDGRDDRGGEVSSGVYFGGLAFGENRIAQRLVFLR